MADAAFLFIIVVFLFGCVGAVLLTFYQPLFQLYWPKPWFKTMWWIGVVIVICTVFNRATNLMRHPG